MIRGPLLGIVLFLVGCAGLPTVQDITDLELALEATKKTIVDTGAAQTKTGEAAVKAIETFESRAAELKDIAASAESWGDAAEGVGGILTDVLPPPFGALVGLATTLLALGRARQNRMAGRNIARAVGAAAAANDGSVKLDDPKAKAILRTMGATASAIVDEGLGKRGGIGI